jgi:hypothetical protein
VTSTLGTELGVNTIANPQGETMSRKLWPLAALAMVAVMGAGCSSAPAETGGGGGGNAANRQQAVKFADCMRHNGVSEFPDPDASGQLTIDAIANGSSVDPNTPAFKQAITACKDLEPPGFVGHKRTTQEQEAGLKFAQCIRENGMKDFPDPMPDGPLIDTDRIPSLAGKDPRSSPLTAAMHKCRDFASAAGVTGGP